MYAYVGNNGVMFVDPTGTVKKWLEENEGNAWYFDTVSLDSISGHSGLYFIYQGQDYLLSYYPQDARDPGSSQENDIFFDYQNGENTQGTYNEDIENILKELSGQKEVIELNNYIELGSKNIDTEKLFEWYIDETSNLPKYNTFVNNCSDEVEKALEAAEFFTYTEFYGIPTPLPGNIGLPGTTPIGLRYDILVELFYKNLFN